METGADRAATIAQRIREATEGLRGLTALRAFLVEVLPTTEVTRLEARIVLPFWSRTVAEQRFAELNDAAMQQWRRELGDLLRQGREDGDVTVTTPDDVLVEAIAAAHAEGARVTAHVGLIDMTGRSIVEGAWVDEGPTLKRIRPRGFGRAFRVTKQLLAMAMGLQVLATTHGTPTPAATQLAMLDAYLSGLAVR